MAGALRAIHERGDAELAGAGAKVGDEGILDLSQLDSLLTKQVKLLSMVHISNSMGTVNPVAELCARARKLGIVTLVDGAQSAGHLPDRKSVV